MENMNRSYKEMKAEERFPILEQGYTIGKLLDSTYTFGQWNKQVFMSKNDF